MTATWWCKRFTLRATRQIDPEHPRGEVHPLAGEWRAEAPMRQEHSLPAMRYGGPDYLGRSLPTWCPARIRRALRAVRRERHWSRSRRRDHAGVGVRDSSTGCSPWRTRVCRRRRSTDSATRCVRRADPATRGVRCAVACSSPGTQNALAAALHNDLQPAAISLRPSLRSLLEAGVEYGALAGVVSGSGPRAHFCAATARTRSMWPLP